MRYLTAGESHGPELTLIIEGLPSGVKIDIDRINAALSLRQRGYGRGGRMAIESDTAVITAGVRGGVSLGSPLSLKIINRDFGAWQGVMGADADKTNERTVTALRPGHADFAGSVKYGFTDARNVLERASARETAVRVAAGAVAGCLLDALGVSYAAHVVNIGGEQAGAAVYSASEILALRGKNDFLCLDENAAARFKRVVDTAIQNKDTVGGVAEVVVSGLPAGIGSHVFFDRKLSTALFAALGSVQSVKCVEIGEGKGYASLFGSAAHDEMQLVDGKVVRNSNRAGGIEGGMTNGEDIVMRATLKPIPTVMKGLKTFDLVSGEPVFSEPERSDVCAVPAAAVVLENAAAFTVADYILQATGGDRFSDVIDRFNALPGQGWK